MKPLGDITSVPTAFSDLTGALATSQEPLGLFNHNSAQQSQLVVAGTSYYITNSKITLPAALKTGIVVGTTLRWSVCLSKSAAGTAAFNIIVFMGTNGTSADTAQVTQSINGSTSTAIIDTMWVDVTLTFTAVGAGTGAFYWSIVPFQRAATATGFGVSSAVSSVFTGTVSSLTTTTGSLIFGLGFSNTTGVPTITVPIVDAQAFNLV